MKERFNPRFETTNDVPFSLTMFRLIEFKDVVDGCCKYFWIHKVRGKNVPRAFCGFLRFFKDRYLILKLDRIKYCNVIREIIISVLLFFFSFAIICKRITINVNCKKKRIEITSSISLIQGSTIFLLQLFRPIARCLSNYLENHSLFEQIENQIDLTCDIPI